jgi:uncharacterized protein with GYD domain
MPKYMIHASYSPEGLRGLQKDKASGRRDAVRQALESVGGRLECVYYAFGQDDVVIIADLPDNVVVSALSLTVSAVGLVKTRTTPLMTVEEVDKSLATKVNYRKPGG